MSFPEYKPSRLASLPTTLDPAEYDVSSEARKAQAERLAIRSQLKREYLLQYNDPNRRVLIVSGEPAGREPKPGVRAVSSGWVAQPWQGGPRSRRPPFPTRALALALFQARREDLLTSPLTLGIELGGQEGQVPGLRPALIPYSLEKVIHLCCLACFPV